MTGTGPAEGWRDWPHLVAISGGVLACAAAVVGIWWAATAETHEARFVVRGAASGLVLDLRGGRAEIVGGGDRPRIEVTRTDRYAFGHQALTTRAVDGGEVHLNSRCPRTVLGACSTEYRVVVPDNIPVTVRTVSGDVRLTGFHGSARVTTDRGDIDVTGFCGFSLQASTVFGHVRAAAVCPPERLLLRSRRGDVRALVPRGRYRIDADSDTGTRTVDGITPEEDATFQIQALSDSGNVEVAGPE